MSKEYREFLLFRKQGLYPVKVQLKNTLKCSSSAENLVNKTLLVQMITIKRKLK